jgi:hypothetical protein
MTPSSNCECRTILAGISSSDTIGAGIPAPERDSSQDSVSELSRALFVSHARHRYRELMDRALLRLAQEIARLGGDYAHVLKEEIEPRHDDRTGEAWMYGRCDYELYRHSEGNPAEANLR